VSAFVQSRFTLGEEFANVWQQAVENHERHSQTGDDESDIRFLALGLTGEAGELANFIKKRWRDGDKHETDIIAEIADVCAYAFMLSHKMGVGPLTLIREIARKQQVFLAKMAARGETVSPDLEDRAR
jgi:NTP pyrophosphatase (non-canonical NTP hydrolase)